jgi:hypothetical protein
MDEGPSQSKSLLAREGISLFVELEALLSSAQENAIGPYPDHDESCTNVQILLSYFLNISFNIIFTCKSYIL